MNKPSQLDYELHCVRLKWKHPTINKRKTEVTDHGHGHYSIKEVTLNPYTYEDFCRDQAKKQEVKVSFIQKIINLLCI